MKKKTGFVFIVLAIFLLPFIIRFFWFFQGIPSKRIISTPDYNNLQVPTSVQSTPIAPVHATEVSHPLILIDTAHSNYFVPSEIEPFTNRMTQLGADIQLADYNTYLSDKLKETSTFIVINPLIAFSNDDIRAVENLIMKGGRLITIGDPTRSSIDSYDYSSATSAMTTSFDYLNQLLSSEGIIYNNDYAYDLSKNEGNFRNIYAVVGNESPLTTGLHNIVLYSTASIRSSGTPFLTGSETTLSSLTDRGGGLVFAAISKSENVVAIGDMSFMTLPYEQSGDNQLLVENLAQFAITSQRSWFLSDYPYIFNSEVAIILSSDLELNATLLTSISSLQNIFRPNHFDIQLLENGETGKDLIILGTYPISENIKKFVNPFGINFDTEPSADVTGTLEPTPDTLITPDVTSTPYDIYGDYTNQEISGTMKIPGFGKLPNTGIGLILYSPSQTGNTLTLLADTSEGLNELIDIFSGGEFSNCIINQNIAVCPLSSSSSDSYGGG